MNKLLQQIYGDGSDEVRKAMNKSFVSFLTCVCGLKLNPELWTPGH